MTDLLECVVNISEGRRLDVLAELSAAAGPLLLDVHRDGDHNRSVFTMAGPEQRLGEAVRALATAAVDRLDLCSHVGAHPRIGVVDVVPWVALSGPPGAAIAARDAFAQWAGTALALPCFLYGPQRSLPEVRRGAWRGLAPDTGPGRPHLSAGASAVGARSVLVAYNLWLADADLESARRVAAGLRGLAGPGGHKAGPIQGGAVRSLGLQVGNAVQVSCNLIDPHVVGPAQVFDIVARQVEVERAELVGLIPAEVFDAIASHRWPELDLDRARTIEARLEQAGLDGGS